MSYLIWLSCVRYFWTKQIYNVQQTRKVKCSFVFIESNFFIKICSKILIHLKIIIRTSLICKYDAQDHLNQFAGRKMVFVDEGFILTKESKGKRK